MSLYVIRRLLWLALAVSTQLAMPVKADTIFSNLGPFISDGDPRTAKPGYDQFVGACGIFASLGSSSSCGVEFTSPGDFVLTQVEVALFRGIGHFEPDPLFLSVRADANGLPGATLVTLPVGVEGSFGRAPRPEVVTSAHGPLLLAGEEYWLVLSTTDTDSDVINGEDLAIWDANSTGGVGPLVSISPSGTQLSLGTQPAFEVDGTLATPEPATLGMLGSGLVMMAWWLRRKAGKSSLSVGGTR